MGSVKFKDLKAYVRYDGNGRVVAGSMVFRKKKPKNGRWYEISSNLCCNAGPNPGTTTTTTTQNVGPTVYQIYCNLANDEATACNGSGGFPNFPLYATTQSINYGTELYLNAELTQPYSGLTWGQYVKPVDSLYVFYVPTTTVANFGAACPVTPIEYVMSIFSDASACGTTSVSPGFSLYSAESNPLAVTVFYTDASLTTPVSGNDSWKTYAKASDQATLYSAYVDAAGNLSGNTAC